MAEIIFSKNFPKAPARVFLVGIGGIGMSGVAQFLRYMGYEVAGSDRGLNESARAGLFDALRAQGIALYPQDGSGPREFHPDAFVFTTAIEPNNPDQLAAPDTPVYHRAYVLSQLCTQCGGTLIGIAGTCGKTSVTGWMGSAVAALGKSVVLIDGGYLPEFETPSAPGNFFATPGRKPEYIVAEIDESDHSISEFSPDFGLVLNVGDDHYETAELERVFRAFLERCKQGGCYPENALAVRPADGRKCVAYDCQARGYQALPSGMRFTTADGVEVESTQSGVHSAWNGSAVYAVLRMAMPNEEPARIAKAMGAFKGVRQRFEVLTKTGAAVAVINDYAHNPEKIAASIRTARERFGAPVGVVFQPHGFGALRFMEEALQKELAGALESTDSFLMLPVYYAGGTVNPSPTSEEVAGRFALAGLPARAIPDRAVAEAALRAGNFKAWLILGARDASLRTWSLLLMLDA